MGQKDMLLELSVTSYHRLSPRQVSVKRFDATGGTLGRSEQADWCLPDPERVVSSVHAQIQFKHGHYSVTDKSTNGLFINRAVEALGPQASHILQHGDVLCLGDYEIQVALVDAQQSSVSNNSTSQSVLSAVTTSELPTPMTADGLTVAQITGGPQVSAGNVAKPNVVASSRINATSAPSLMSDFALDEHFTSPLAMIPDDWDANWQHDEMNPAPSADAPMSSTPSGSAKPAASADFSTEVTNACLQAFIRGLGISEVNQQGLNNSQSWEQLGQALQQSLQGVMHVMRERSQVKSAFRVNQTTFQQRENNPLKFSANIDDAFHNLFNRPGSSFMPARQAIAEAFTDISRHEAAIIAGANGAIRGLLSEIAPERIAATDMNAGFIEKVNPALKQARLWLRFKDLHNALSGEWQQRHNTAVSDDFITSYEAYLRNK